MGTKLKKAEADRIWELYENFTEKDGVSQDTAKMKMVGIVFRSPASIGRIVNAYTAAKAGRKPQCASASINIFAEEYFAARNRVQMVMPEFVEPEARENPGLMEMLAEIRDLLKALVNK